MDIRNVTEIIKQGHYYADGQKVDLKLSRKQMEDAQVFLPDSIRTLQEVSHYWLANESEGCSTGCVNMDALELARIRAAEVGNADRVLVLNVVSPEFPGEEEFCGRTTLYSSLAGSRAQRYYQYNRAADSYLAYDAVILHPHVEIIEDETGGLLPDTTIVSVISCASFMLMDGPEDPAREEREKILLNRIYGMLSIAAFKGYKNIVLSDFGCGALCNDARLVSSLFMDALSLRNEEGKSLGRSFRRIDFAVPDRSRGQYNYNEFVRKFGSPAAH